MLSNLSKQTLGSNKCYCEEKFKNVNSVAPAGCADDDAAVAALPDTWVPKHGGPILANYLKEKQQKHEGLTNDMKEAAVSINAEIDLKIRNLGEELLANIQQSQRYIDNIIEKCEALGVPIAKEIRKKALNEIIDHFKERIDNITQFKLNALTFERERADGLRALLQDYFQKLIAIGHKPPKDLMHDFDQQIYDINQQLLSNCRAYTELEGQLRLQADENLVSTKSVLNQFSLGVARINRGRSAQLWFKERGPSAQRTSSAVDKNRQPSDSSIKKILGNVEEIDECVNCLVQAYKTAVLKVYTSFCGKLTVLQKDLGSHHVIHEAGQDRRSCEIIDLQPLIERVLRCPTISVHKKQTPSKDLLEITDADIAGMQKSLSSLGECLKDTYTILHDAGHLWDSHMLRLGLAQKLTVAAVEDLLTNNDSLELCNEISFNIAVEQLRCCSDADKLQQQYEAILTMLERISEMYLHHSDAEIGRLQEFMKLPPFMSRILLSEFDCFLEKYRRTSLESPLSITNLPGLGSSRSDRGSVLRYPGPRAILQTELQEISLQNWRNGFLESFQSNMSFIPEELQHQCQLWIEERARVLHMRYSLKLVSNSIRVERVKAARDTRLAELRFHETRLESHLAAINNLIERLPLEASEFLSLDSEYLYPLCKWTSRIQDNMNAMIPQDPMDPELRRLKMLSYGPRLAKHRKLFEESLDIAIAQYKKQLEHRIQEGRISNVRFMSQIRLFSEGGRYAAQEATKTSAALIKGADSLEVCFNRTMDAVNHRRSQLLAMADQHILPLQKVIEDVYKVGGKGADKRKPAPAKKK